mmetsp:Transcript_11908/g.27004  ORF Transcript_11908/g.27004 Transcript_11908/m.27004 type:complete len:325 (-) Transcript_11908:64-1038(-)
MSDSIASVSLEPASPPELPLPPAPALAVSFAFAAAKAACPCKSVTERGLTRATAAKLSSLCAPSGQINSYCTSSTCSPVVGTGLRDTTAGGRSKSPAPISGAGADAECDFEFCFVAAAGAGAAAVAAVVAAGAGAGAGAARGAGSAMFAVPVLAPLPSDMAAAAAAAAQPETTRLRWEQDDAYEESLRADRAREAERRKQQEEEEEAQREAVEAERAAQLEEDRKAAEFAESDNDAPPEPATGPRVALRLLNGSRVVRRFSADDTLLEIRRWARRALRDAGCVPDGAWSVKGEGDMFPTSRDELKASTVAQHGVGGSVLNIVRL